MGNQPSNPAIQRVKRAMSSTRMVMVDGGTTVTNSKLYTNDYSKQLVAKAILDRRIAPFYTPTESEDSQECPICFLNYKRMNTTRCCDQAICTDCFLQIKRPETTFEPASCPFCVHPHFGVVYTPPEKIQSSQLSESQDNVIQRKKSLEATNPLVFTSDHVRPDWEERKREMEMKAALEQQRIALAHARRRQLEALSAAQAALISNGGYPGGGAFRFSGVDVEEMMLLEAMRRSMQDSVPAVSEEERRAIDESMNMIPSTSSPLVATEPVNPPESTGEEAVQEENIATVSSEDGKAEVDSQDENENGSVSEPSLENDISKQSPQDPSPKDNLPHQISPAIPVQDLDDQNPTATLEN